MPRTPNRQTPSVEHDEQCTPAPPDARSFADVDESSAESFPASDPPAWASLRVGAPRAPVVHEKEQDEGRVR